MKTKEQKRNEARKTAEAGKAARKVARGQKGTSPVNATNGKKGKSLVPQPKAKGGNK